MVPHAQDANPVRQNSEQDVEWKAVHFHAPDTPGVEPKAKAARALRNDCDVVLQALKKLVSQPGRSFFIPSNGLSYFTGN